MRRVCLGLLSYLLSRYIVLGSAALEDIILTGAHLRPRSATQSG